MFGDKTLQKKLKIKYPLIQAPMLGVTSPLMVAKIANAGGLGSLPVGGLSPNETISLINQVKQNTSKSFSVNFFAYKIPEISKFDFEAMQDFLSDYCQQQEITYKRKSFENIQFYSYKDQVNILLEEDIPVISFTFGIPDDETINKFKSSGKFLIGTATSVEEAILLEKKGIDAVVAQGIEAGGHRGSFLSTDKLPDLSTFVLIPSIIKEIKIPVIAAGGLADSKSIIASSILGATAFQIGSLFLRSKESNASTTYKEVLKNNIDKKTELTRAFSGRWARAVYNDFMEKIINSGLNIPQYPFQNYLTADIRIQANKLEIMDLISLYAGQRAFEAPEASCDEIFLQLVKDIEELLPSLKNSFMD